MLEAAPLLTPAASPAEIVEEAVASRRSVRGFLPNPVDLDLVARILAVARRAPSGSNIQPWQVHVLTGQPLRTLAEELTSVFLAGEPEAPDYAYYPTHWRSPYIERRRQTGWSLYALTGVERGDHEAGQRQRAKNYSFFGAPVGLVFAIDRDLNPGSWVDNGMFMQNVMVLARGHGLHTCPLAAIGNYPPIVRRHLGIPDSQMVIAGMAIGHEDVQEPANRLRTTREELSTFCTFHTD